MLALGPSHRFHYYREPTDMRKGFDGLCGLVRSGMKRDPLSGDVFVFINRRRTHAKFLVWDRSGWVVYYKRLESGTFELPCSGTPDRLPSGGCGAEFCSLSSALLTAGSVAGMTFIFVWYLTFGNCVLRGRYEPYGRTQASYRAFFGPGWGLGVDHRFPGGEANGGAPREVEGRGGG